MQKLKNWNIPWGSNDFVTVCYGLCPQFPVQAPQTLTPQDLLAQQLWPSKGVQRLRGDVAHDLKLNNGEKCWDRFSIPKEWAMKLNDVVPVIVCAWKFSSNPSQSPHSKQWHHSVYWHGGCGLVKASVPSRWYNAWCSISCFSRVVVDLRNAYFCQKIWIRLRNICRKFG